MTSKTKKTAPKKATKKTAAKKAPAKKKSAPKKAAKKTVAKKAPAKKTAAKKAPAKKVVKNSKPKAIKKVVKTTTVVTTTTTTTKVNPKETHYLLVLDESTSMTSVRNETLTGINEQIKTIKSLEKKFPDHKYIVSIVKFSTTAQHLIQEVPASKVEELSNNDYMPQGWTALHDAIGMGVNTLNTKIKSKLDSGEASALVVIITDGEENSSKEFNSLKIKDLITGLEKTGMWTFTFIGANQDAVLTAKSLGVSLGNTVNYNASGAGTNLAFMSVNSALSKRAIYSNAGVYASTQDNFLSEVTRGLSDIGEDASKLDLSGDVTAEDIQKAKDALDNKDSNK
jgi:hypothetical protein